MESANGPGPIGFNFSGLGIDREGDHRIGIVAQAGIETLLVGADGHRQRAAGFGGARHRRGFDRRQIAVRFELEDGDVLAIGFPT